MDKNKQKEAGIGPFINIVSYILVVNWQDIANTNVRPRIDLNCGLTKHPDWQIGQKGFEPNFFTFCNAY